MKSNYEKNIRAVKQVEIIIFDTKTFIIRPEYLMAIMLQTYRSKDRERLLLFFNQADYSQSVFEEILNNHHLTEKYELFRKKYIDE